MQYANAAPQRKNRNAHTFSEHRNAKRRDKLIDPKRAFTRTHHSHACRSRAVKALGFESGENERRSIQPGPKRTHTHTHGRTKTNDSSKNSSAQWPQWHLTNTNKSSLLFTSKSHGPRWTRLRANPIEYYYLLRLCASNLKEFPIVFLVCSISSIVVVEDVRICLARVAFKYVVCWIVGRNPRNVSSKNDHHLWSSLFGLRWLTNSFPVVHII